MPWWRHGRLLLLVLLTAAGIIALGFFSRSHPRPSVGVRPAVPEGLDRFRPAVKALVEQHIARVLAHPNDGAAHAELALVYEANTLWRLAREQYARALQLSPQHAESDWWRLHLAIATRESGDWETALAQLRQLAQQRPQLAPVWHRLGQALLEAGQLDEAGNSFQKLIELEPDCEAGLAGLADVRLRQGDPEAAVPLLKRAVELSPNYRLAHYVLGSAYRRLGQEELAAVELARGVDARVEYLPDPLARRAAGYAVDIRALVSQGARWLAAGDLERARTVLEDVLQQDAANVTAMNNLAVTYAGLGRMADAEKLLLRAKDLDDQKYTTYVNLAQWSMRARQLDRALEYAQAAVDRAPHQSLSHLTLAKVLARLGQLPQAMNACDEAVARGPDDYRASTFAGQLCLRLNRLDDAQRHFRRAVTFAPNWLDGWLGLAQVHLELGQVDQADEALRQVRQRSPNHPRVRQLEQTLSRARASAPR